MSALAKIMDFKEYTIPQLLKLYTDAKTTYHQGDDPIMTDAEFDKLEEFLRSHPDCDSSILDETGADPKYGDKVELPAHFGSQDKFFPQDLDQIPSCHTFVVSNKVDGLSGIFVIKNKNVNLYSRGNGTIGTDWSRCLKHMKLPKVTSPKDSTIIIRGEVTMNNDVFEKYYPDKKTSRNVVCGIMNRKDISKSDIGRLRFIAYEIVEPRMTAKDQMDQLQSWNFETPEPLVIENTGSTQEFMDTLSTRYKDQRQNAPYDIDGLVVVCNDDIYQIDDLNKKGNPSYSKAFKMRDILESAATTIMDVRWKVSKDGYLKPVGVLDPVTLNGVRIENVTLKNAGNVLALGLGPGAKVRIIRSGDVIPEIVEVIKKAEPSFPDVEYKWTESKADIIVTNLDDNPQIKIAQLVKLFETIECDGLGPGTVEKLVEQGHTTIHDILDADLEAIEGIGSKSAIQIKENIRQALQNASPAMISAGLPESPRGFQVKTMEKILEVMPKVFDMNGPSIEEIKSTLKNTPGFGPKKIAALVESIDDIRQSINGLKHLLPKRKNIGKESKENKSDKTNKEAGKKKSSLAGKYYIFSGVRSKDLEKEIKDRGGTILSSLTKKHLQNSEAVKHTMLIVKALDSSSSKVKVAKSHGIKIDIIKNLVKSLSK